MDIFYELCDGRKWNICARKADIFSTGEGISVSVGKQKFTTTNKFPSYTMARKEIFAQILSQYDVQVANSDEVWLTCAQVDEFLSGGHDEMEQERRRSAGYDTIEEQSSSIAIDPEFSRNTVPSNIANTRKLASISMRSSSPNLLAAENLPHQHSYESNNAKRNKKNKSTEATHHESLYIESKFSQKMNNRDTLHADEKMRNEKNYGSLDK
ncbi:hypothetical protein HK098_003610 [Nowakowskiella sp. JEL0407]|nr:hypothetical protein HK098_003610 [Nowakowskiella sp. JEL0407]